MALGDIGFTTDLNINSVKVNIVLRRVLSAYIEVSSPTNWLPLPIVPAGVEKGVERWV